jgi:diaminohydroxyphosphoribosylaminopyrimidine deaminase / 5-amino-6-(5-phosphoribosylamino)uracil reductase
MKNESYLRRARDLAMRAGTATKTNPRVGAVLVADGRIIGEGYHKCYGGPHAEVEAIASVQETELLRQATLYVTLEPCCHTNKKTPPCVEHIIRLGIPRVVVGCKDPNPAVSGKGIDALRAAGVQVEMAQDIKPYLDLIKSFRVQQLFQRPYITLKWAETRDGFIGSRVGRMLISGREALELTHALRAQHQAILVGMGTYLADEPRLDVRHYSGQNPTKLVLSYDLTNTLGIDIQLLDAKEDLHTIFKRLYTEEKIGSVLVEGGQQTLQRLIDSALWDEVFVYRSQTICGGDVPAPVLPTSANLTPITRLGSDTLFRTFAQRV